MTKRFNICRIQPDGYRHGATFDEIVETLQFGLTAVGCEVSNSINTPSLHAHNIVIGTHLLSEEACRALSANTILFNFEQLHEGSLWTKPGYMAALSHCEVWDYSQRNLDHIGRTTENRRLQHVPVGYAPSLSRIPKAPNQDIDVLFYGSLNERRNQIINRLKTAGLAVTSVFGVYGAQRDELIARAKLVLNVHFYASSIFEIVRVSYLLANSKAVVAECHDQTEIYPDLRDALRTAHYEGLVDACIELVSNNTLRQHYETVGFKRMQARSMTDILRPVVNAPRASMEVTTTTDSDVANFSTPIPTRMNMGSGKDWRADWFNVDITERVKPDLVLDFTQPLPWGVAIASPRFGHVSLREGYFEHIMANDVLEHIPDLVTAMTSCLRLLRIGGEMHVQVPYDLSFGAWQDPTHVRAFNERSWLYFTDWFWYLGWNEARFDLTEQVAVLSPIGKKLQAEGMAMETIMRTPRAVDGLHVKLRKRELTPQEVQLSEQMRNPGRAR